MRYLAAFLAFIFYCSLSHGANDGFKEDLIRAINQVREEHHLSQLKSHQVLMDLSQDWSEKLYKLRRLKHRGGFKPYLKANDWRLMNENIFFANPPVSAEEVVKGWMGSSEHRENLLEPSLDYIGVGECRKQGDQYVVFNGSAMFK
jgi:uncharacterized protein YkwD